jgi:hypothetical protein
LEAKVVKMRERKSIMSHISQRSQEADNDKMFNGHLGMEFREDAGASNSMSDLSDDNDNDKLEKELNDGSDSSSSSSLGSSQRLSPRERERRRLAEEERLRRERDPMRELLDWEEIFSKLPRPNPSMTEEALPSRRSPARPQVSKFTVSESILGPIYDERFREQEEEQYVGSSARYDRQGNRLAIKSTLKSLKGKMSNEELVSSAAGRKGTKPRTKELPLFSVQNRMKSSQVQREITKLEVSRFTIPDSIDDLDLHHKKRQGKPQSLKKKLESQQEILEESVIFESNAEQSTDKYLKYFVNPVHNMVEAVQKKTPVDKQISLMKGLFSVERTNKEEKADMDHLSRNKVTYIRTKQ